jgi:hypothetical protein
LKTTIHKLSEGVAMPVLIVRYDVAEEGVAEVAAAVEAAFAAVREEAPDGVRYSYLRRAGGTEFVALLQLADGLENPLPGIAAARHLQATVAKWAVGEPPAPAAFEVLGDYQLLA